MQTQANSKRLVRQLLLFVVMSVLAIKAYSTSFIAYEKQQYDINIPASNAVEAINQLALQTDVVMLFPYSVAKSRQANAVAGRYTLKAALAKLLLGSGLVSDLSDDGVINISLDENVRLNNNDGREEMNNRKKILAATIGFFMGAGGVPGVMAEEVDGAEGMDWLLEEVIVTANKRETSLQDTAMSIIAISKETIEKRNFVGMQDYLAKTPGVEFLELYEGNNRVVVRGLAASIGEAATVGIYLGEMPFTSVSTNRNPDIRLVDIERVEILKGPQGTLYGAGALGGAVRSIPVKPNLTEFEGDIKVSASSQAESDDFSHSMVGAINIPLIDEKMALRVAAYRYDEAGYVDAVSTPELDAVVAATGIPLLLEDDFNSSTITGARASLLWELSDNLSTTIILGTQERNFDAVIAHTIRALGDYKGHALDIRSGADYPQTADSDYANLQIEYDLGWASLVSSSSLVKNEGYLEDSLWLSTLTYPHDNFFSPLLSVGPYKQDTVSQEFRLVS
ncbi:TonB-dependent receptor plug domain-containing protein, partial [Porticoccaceae bacterium]|nr:TonB-dependent receptor plug domain-containing protein [Porticoccaceae bacterium]